MQHSDLTAIDFFNDVDDMYGMDPDGPEPIDTDGTVVVSNLPFQLNGRDLQTLQAIVNPLADSQNYGIDLYEQTVHFIQCV